MPTRKQRNNQIEPSDLAASSETLDPLADTAEGMSPAEAPDEEKTREDWDIMSSASKPGFKIGWPSKPNTGAYGERQKEAKKLNMVPFRLLSPVTFDNLKVDIRLGEVGFLPGAEVKMLLKKGRVSVDEDSVTAAIDQLKRRTG